MAPSVEETNGTLVSTAKQHAPETHTGNMITHMAAGQKQPLASVQMPKFDDPLVERQWRKEHMAAAFRFMAKQGYDDASVAGHISVRDPIHPEQFWINPFAKSFKLMKVSDLVLVNEEGIVLEGGNMHAINAAGFAIHSEIHAARPDVVAAVHAHSTAGKAFSTLGIELDMITQDTCRFYKDHTVYHNFGGVVLDREEGKRIAKSLGDASAILLQNHGILTVGRTVDAAAFLFASMERCCAVQMMADTAAKARGISTVKISEAEAAFSHQIQNDNLRYVAFQPSYEELLEETNGAFLK